MERFEGDATEGIGGEALLSVLLLEGLLLVVGSLNGSTASREPFRAGRAVAAMLQDGRRRRRFLAASVSGYNEAGAVRLRALTRR